MFCGWFWASLRRTSGPPSNVPLLDFYPPHNSLERTLPARSDFYGDFKLQHKRATWGIARWNTLRAEPDRGCGGKGKRQRISGQREIVLKERPPAAPWPSPPGQAARTCFASTSSR